MHHLTLPVMEGQIQQIHSPITIEKAGPVKFVIAVWVSKRLDKVGDSIALKKNKHIDSSQQRCIYGLYP